MVGMLFLQGIWILHSYGLSGTLGLLMAPEQALGAGGRGSSTYLSVAPPKGAGSELVVAYDKEAGLQRLHWSFDGACASWTRQLSAPA